MIPAPGTDQRSAIFQVACNLMKQNGYEQTSMQDIAASAGLPVSEVYKYFGKKEDVVFYLYRCVNADWEAEVAGLPEGKLPGRFAEAIYIKLALIAPYKDLLQKLLPLLISGEDLGVFSIDNQVIRMQGMAIVEHVLNGSKGLVLGNKRKRQMARTLYMMHWAVMFISLHEQQDKKALKLLDTFTGWLKELNLAKQVVLPLLLPKLTELTDIVLEETTESTTTAKAVLEVIFNKRKLLPGSSCNKKYCDQCYNLHLPRVQYFIDRNEPVQIILPAFPAKSPNLEKVLGKLPDLGEEIALLALQGVCDDIKRIYKPGAQMIICADGRIFADLVQVSDEDVTAYTSGLKRLIKELKTTHITILNLEDFLKADNFNAARAYVIERYAEPLDNLREKIKQDGSYKTLFNGMHRFITEDRLYTEPEKSKSRVKEEAKDIAIQVIQRSNAWTKFLAYHYPDAVRLSIHPQSPHSEKIGIRLTRSADEWITPWHGVVVLNKEDYTLMKKHEAEKLNAQLVYKNDMPSHYTMNN